MRLSLIGMAGTGKSYWSGRLAESDFRCFCCDDMIAGKLAPELRRPDGSTMKMGEWMGLPYEAQYAEREARYLACEIEILSSIFDLLESGDVPSDEDIVIDTTGSVIYTGEAVLERLVALTTVVHLTTPVEQQEKMLKEYLADPGPVLWHGLFSVEPGESNAEALGRSYEKLLLTRERLYKRCAQVTIDFYKHRQKGFDVNDFLAEITPKREVIFERSLRSSGRRHPKNKSKVLSAVLPSGRHNAERMLRSQACPAPESPEI